MEPSPFALHVPTRWPWGTFIKVATTEEIGCCYSSGIVFLSTDGIECDLPIFRRTNGLSCEIFLLLFESHLSKVLCFLYNRIYPQAALVFIASSSVSRLGSQMVDCDARMIHLH
jgi:hypothetical protein